MARKGLTGETVVRKAAELIERDGIHEFSVYSLAETLGIKPASLYNHIESVDSLLLDVCRLFLLEQNQEVMKCVGGMHRDSAVSALAEAYYRFDKEHRELYWLMIRKTAIDKDLLDDAAVSLTDPLKAVLEDYAIQEEVKIHFRRLFRSIVHGFVSEEDIGFFSHYPAKPEDSFRFAIRGYIDLLNRAEKETVL